MTAATIGQIKQQIQQLTNAAASSHLPSFWFTDWLLFVIKQPSSFLITDENYQLTDSELTQFHAGVTKMQQGTPLAYLTGQQEFWSLNFKVNEHTLIPRPDTEVLIEQVLAWINSQPKSADGNNKPKRLLDLGTGSGCIAISLAHELDKRQPNNKAKNWQVVAVDLSLEALKVARHNAMVNEVAADIKFIQSSWYEALSAQVKSCLLLAGLWAKGTTTVIQPEVSRDHTERMLSAFGYPVTVDGNRVSVEGGGTLTGGDIAVPADISSAAFFMVAAAISQGSELTLTQVGINPTRTGIIDILKLMNADISLSNETHVGGEPVADITIRSSSLKGIEIPEYLVPLAIDEFPVLFIAASCAQGRTVLTGAKELRVKESDRIAVMADGLQTLGIDCTVTEDGLIIEGKGIEGKGSNVNEVNNNQPIFGGGHITSHHDHRIAMSFAVASLRAAKQITIEGVETVNTSFPGFAELANQIGMSIKVDNGAA